ncbi:glycosyltransferase family 39 protein, partial [Candidatus Amesbacteria bacterium]|nr:glycosyltransferase family 39 protein [Candidatus Amesbacteria bacterium]
MSKYLFIIILLLAAFFRFYGLNWDQNQHLHPDERFLTMVAIGMKWPTNLLQYFDTQASTLNPHNVGYGFYVYGTFPVILVKSIAEALKLGDYHNLTLVGRFISSLLDLGTTVLVFLISRRLFKSPSAALLTMFVYAISVLPIQLSHFFAVDTFLVFFLVLSFYLLITNNYLLLGIAFGLAIASKITAVLFA